ncbi:uncharacterized protein LOC132752756 isoform X3 [Ruditapes philippinarum]|uniref:uncharacterized protein LOC132752756 isoform X3 n=1 Tax=Ruditapes philippinarum TaxID=129788 RepID=UPI00295B6D98|nr:uncharacterized protein LOC132752756 isoform X3 [Ruditapes philippinarum]XP_060599117.1 uncharacterized protein LOC132752756 isoform X3 [Ruditapes philippinarum]XP_060599118.1 uncharacterized protein LOC132752756 isoform X3 [Ruditapes philippinarum]XP_060599119.1 uncharacterized protein LOC132752756 isoform X3 [Ruditapes philippinarum]
MAGTYYHQEALRKARLIERKTEAMRRLQDSLGDSQEGPGIVESKPSNLVFSEAGHYAQNRSDNVRGWEKNEVVFEEVVHDPNFKYRISKDSGNRPVHVDPIYKILYPGGVTRK